MVRQVIARKLTIMGACLALGLPTTAAAEMLRHGVETWTTRDLAYAPLALLSGLSIDGDSVADGSEESGGAPSALRLRGTFSEGVRQGRLDAGTASTASWARRGFTLGLLLPGIGCIVVGERAVASDPIVSPDAEVFSPAYIAGYHQGFDEARAERAGNAAFLGGLAGSLVTTIICGAIVVAVLPALVFTVI